VMFVMLFLLSEAVPPWAGQMTRLSAITNLVCSLAYTGTKFPRIRQL